MGYPGNQPKDVYSICRSVKGKLGNRPSCTSKHVTTHACLSQLSAVVSAGALCWREYIYITEY